MNLETLLEDLGYDPDIILRDLGRERVLSLIQMMLRSVNLPINVLVLRTYYGIGCESVTTKKLGERLLPPLTEAQVHKIRKETLNRLKFEEERVQILQKAIQVLPTQPP